MRQSFDGAVVAVRAGATMRPVARQSGVSLLTVQRSVAAGRRPRPRRGRVARPDLGAPSPAGADPGRARGRDHPAADHPAARQPAGRVRRRGHPPRAPRSRLERTDSADDRPGPRPAGCPRQPRPDAPPGATAGLVPAERGQPPGGSLGGLPGRCHRQGLRLRGGIDIEILTLISLHGGLPGAWPELPLTTPRVIAALLGHWRDHGLPGYVQFDNAMIFAGSHGLPDSAGRPATPRPWRSCPSSRHPARWASRRPSRASTGAGSPGCGGASTTGPGGRPGALGRVDRGLPGALGGAHRGGSGAPALPGRVVRPRASGAPGPGRVPAPHQRACCQPPAPILPGRLELALSARPRRGRSRRPRHRFVPSGGEIRGATAPALLQRSVAPPRVTRRCVTSSYSATWR